MFCLIVASNNEAILNSNLLASPDMTAMEISVQRDASSSAEAYNRGINATHSDIMIFAHQDMFLPAGWLLKLQKTLEKLEQQDPDWGVLGMFGVTASGTSHGHLYSTGLQQVLGHDFDEAKEVESLDEIVLVLRRVSGLRFDGRLPGFHLYGTDICLEAKKHGLKSYAFSAFGMHNSNGIPILPMAYWKCYLHLRRKWWRYLPVKTPCIEITSWSFPALLHLMRSIPLMLQPREIKTKRVDDPREFFARLTQHPSS
jgi:hypothetical protein